MTAFSPTDCRPELPSGCPRCGENGSPICCDVEHPNYFKTFSIPPLKVDHTMCRSRIKPVKLNERTAADVKLIDALEDWCEATTKTRYGEAALLDFGPSLIMSTRVLDRIIDCVHHNKISSVQDLAHETRWDEVGRYGSEILAVIQAIYPLPPLADNPEPQSSQGPPSAKKIRCGSCGQLGHNGMKFILLASCIPSLTITTCLARSLSCPHHPRSLTPTRPHSDFKENNLRPSTTLSAPLSSSPYSPSPLQFQFVSYQPRG